VGGPVVGLPGRSTALVAAARPHATGAGVLLFRGDHPGRHAGEGFAEHLRCAESNWHAASGGAGMRRAAAHPCWVLDSSGGK
jgi:hypothetical protein